MGGFLPRFATLYVVIVAYSIGTGDADATCTDEAGNNLCQGLSSFKGAIEDRRAYEPDGEQDLSSGPMSAEIFPPPSFRLQHESSSARDMALWLVTGLGLEKNPETVTLYRGPAGFAVVFVQPQPYAEEEGQDANMAKGSYRQATTNSKQTVELNLGEHAKPEQPEGSAQSQVQQPMADWLAAKSRSPLQSNMGAPPQVKSVSDQQPQAEEQQQNSVQGPALGVHQNIIQRQPLGAVSGGTAPQAADARAVVHHSWISNLQPHQAPVDNQHKQQRTGLWRIFGEKQHKPMMTDSLAGRSLSLTGQPVHRTITWHYQRPTFLSTSLKQEPGVASVRENHIFQQGGTPQQGAAVNVPSDYQAMLGHGASTGHISHLSEHHQHVAVTTTIIGPHPGQVVAGTHSPLPIQQTQQTTAQIQQQSTQPQQQASTNFGVGATLVERIAHQQQGAPKDVQQQSVHKPEELSAQAQQQLPVTNAPQNTTQAPAVAQGTSNVVAPVAPQQAAKPEAVPSATTPPHEVSATTTSPAQQVTAQQPVVQGIGTTKK